jgi:hypothetical protein
MAYNPHPSAYFPNCEVSSTGIYIPYTDLESYKISTSGDVRQLAYSFLDAVATPYLGLGINDRPDQITISRSWQAVSDSTIKKIYAYSFNLSFSGVSVTPES